jgi:hypothetical protein
MIKLVIGAVFLFVMGLIIASGIDVGDPAVDCEENDIIAVQDNEWICTQELESLNITHLNQVINTSIINQNSTNISTDYLTVRIKSILQGDLLIPAETNHTNTVRVKSGIETHIYDDSPLYFGTNNDVQFVYDSGGAMFYEYGDIEFWDEMIVHDDAQFNNDVTMQDNLLVQDIIYVSDTTTGVYLDYDSGEGLVSSVDTTGGILKLQGGDYSSFSIGDGEDNKGMTLLYGADGQNAGSFGSPNTGGNSNHTFISGGIGGNGYGAGGKAGKNSSVIVGRYEYNDQAIAFTMGLMDYNDLVVSGNLGVVGNVNVSGLYYGDGSKLTNTGNSSWNQTLATTLYQPLEDQRLSTTDDVTFNDIDGENIIAESSTFPVLGFTRLTTVTSGSFDGTSGIASAMRLVTKTSGNMGDGFGGGIVFYGQDNGLGSPTTAGRLYTRRDGADNEWAMQFFAGTNGNDRQMIIRADGDVGIGTTAPSKKLDVNGDISLESGSGDYYSNDGSQGWTGTFINGDGDTVTVKNGIITDVS